MAANTANRRVLVTNKDGSQVVKTIEQELGIKRGDKEEMRRRLQGQGEKDIEGLDLYGSYEDVREGRKGAVRPSLGNGAGRGDRPQNRPGNPSNGANRQNQRPNGQRDDRRNSSGRREAWGNSNDFPDFPAPGGDQSLPPSYNDDNRRQSSNSPRHPRSSNQRSSALFTEDNRPQSASVTMLDQLKKLLYTPPVNIEGLCIKLQISSVTTTPRMPQGAFFKRLSTLDPSLTKGQLSAIWKMIDSNNVGYVDINSLLEMLQSRYGKDKNSTKNGSVLEKVIKKILERCGENAGIKGLSR
jgi:Ca2+-binding EF-hand superfamily protein